MARNSAAAPALACALVVVVATACSHAPFLAAVGSYSDVVLCSSRDVAAAGLQALSAALETRVEYVGEEERLFHVTVTSEQRLSAERFGKNLLLVVVLDAPGAAAREVRRLLGGPDVEHLRRQGAAFFVRRDVWARGQVVVLLVATRAADLATLLAAAGPDVAALFESTALERYRAELLPGSVGEERAAEFGARYGFEIRAPEPYRTLPVNAAWPAAVELARPAPARLLTVFWLDGVDSLQAADRPFVLGLQRDAMWRLHGDTLVEARTRFEPVRLGPYTGLRLAGVWQNSRDIAGGAFRTHFVYDAGARRLYGVQALVFAPGRDKHPLMRELLALAETFRLRGGAS